MPLLDLPTGRLAYWDVGQGSPVLFIHGVGTTGELWLDDLRGLADGHRLIVYNRRGYQPSSESPRRWLEHRDDAAALLATLGIERAAVIGYSGGASIALDLALQKPALVTSLVLLDPAVNIKQCVTPGMIRALLTAQVLRRLRGERRGAEAWMRYVGSYSTGGTAFDKVSPARRETILSNARGMFGDAAVATKHVVDEARLAGVRPVTIVDAKLSPPFLRRSADRLHRAMPHARRVTIESAGHHIAVDARDELITILRDVLAHAPAQSSASA